MISKRGVIVSLLIPISLFGADANFSLDGNGVTIKCDSASVGESGAVGGTTYTKISVKEDLTTHGGSVAASQACTSGITNMDNWFKDQGTFNDDITHWDTSSVTSMMYMFKNATDFNQSIGQWNVSSVTNMYTMFESSKFNQPLNNWDVSSVTNMSYMFHLANDFNQDLSNWDTSNVQNMARMFRRAHAFNQDISSWDTSSATGMSYMFANNLNFSQDLSGWCVKEVSSYSNFAAGAVIYEAETAKYPPFGSSDNCPAPPTPPSVTSTPLESVDEDSSYNYTLTATDVNSDDTLSWSVKGGTTLPSWLELLELSTPLDSNDIGTPVSITADSSGNIYIVDSDNNTVVKYDGTNVTTLVDTLIGPRGVAVDSSGNLYVLNTANDSLSKFDSSGTLVSTLISDPSVLQIPFGLASDSSGNIYIADTYNHAIKNMMEVL